MNYMRVHNRTFYNLKEALYLSASWRKNFRQKQADCCSAEAGVVVVVVEVAAAAAVVVVAGAGRKPGPCAEPGCRTWERQRPRQRDQKVEQRLVGQRTAEHFRCSNQICGRTNQMLAERRPSSRKRAALRIQLEHLQNWQLQKKIE